ncbi:MAG: glycosyltransferase family 4 protein [Clostridiales bacterium]|nr:glycosyltransferase family 4 protein [Clostridiales bacterium]
MKLAFVSNYLNHHQVHLCNQFYNNCEEFYFIATEKIPLDRLEMGYEDMDSKYPYVIRIYEDNHLKYAAYYIIKTFDVVIFGACPTKLIELRMKNNMLSFIYIERLLKKGLWYRYIPSTRKKIEDRVLKYKDRKLYVLCASAYTSYDLYLCGFMGKCYKWGYFTEVAHVNKSELMNKKDKSHCKILWVGRLINGKCTKDVIFLAKILMKQKLNFTIDIIGGGKYEKQLHMLVELLGLSERINFLGVMSPDKVKEYMEKANIFLCTSNFKEGWGAVINEAMSSGCAVVASHAIGSVPYLIEHKRNGLIYRSGNINDLSRKVIWLIKNPKLQFTYGMKAYDTMVNRWSPEQAAGRFIEICKNLMAERQIWYRNGPCSRAYIIKEDWYPLK